MLAAPNSILSFIHLGIANDAPLATQAALNPAQVCLFSLGVCWLSPQQHKLSLETVDNRQNIEQMMGGRM